MPDTYRLEILDPLGKVVIKRFTPYTEGVADGISCGIDPLNGCDTLEFSGVPSDIEAEGGQITRCFIETDTGIHPVFFGALITGAPETKDDGVAEYESNARTLLLASPVPAIRYRNQDTAAIALDLTQRSKHAALSVRPQDFVPSGTILDSFSTTDTDGSLADALDKLVQATEDPDYGAGLDPSGFVFFRPNRLVLELPYADTGYEDMASTATTITTATLWTYAEQPSVTPWGGAYNPLAYTHLSISNAELHERYGYARGRKLPQYALEETYNTSFTSSNFSNPGGAVITDSSYALRSGGAGSYTLTNDDPLVVGVRLKYRASEDAGEIFFRAHCGVLYKVELPNTDGELQTLDIPLVPHEGNFAKWDWFRINAATGGSFELHGFYPLAVNPSVLDAAAPLVVPEQKPGQIVLPGIGELAAYIKLLGAPRGDIERPCAAQRWSWSKDAGAETVRDLGISAVEAEGEGKVNRVRSYFRS